MRKILCMIMVFVILSGFCACQVQEESTESTGLSQNSGMPPPRSIHAYSTEAWTAVIDSAKLSDAAFAEFVAQASADPDDQIRIPSNTKRQEVEALVQFIATVGIPMLKSDVKPERVYIEYCTETPKFMSSYTIDGIRYIFTIYQHKGNIIRFKGEADGIWAIGEDSISLIRDVENRNGKFVIGRLYRGDYGILVEIFDTTGEKKAKDIDLQTIAPIKFDWCYALGA